MNMRSLSAAAILTATLAMPAAAAPVVSDAWIRALPGKLPAAGYVTLKNPDKAPLSLTGAETKECGSLMLHMTHNMGGMVHMMEVPNVEIPANGTVKFAPGGYHLMCKDASATVKPGATIPITLIFSDKTRLTVSFTVRNAKGDK